LYPVRVPAPGKIYKYRLNPRLQTIPGWADPNYNNAGESAFFTKASKLLSF